MPVGDKALESILGSREGNSYLRRQHEGSVFIHLQHPVLQHRAQDIGGIEGQPPHHMGPKPGEMSCPEDGWLSCVRMAGTKEVHIQGLLEKTKTKKTLERLLTERGQPWWVTPEKPPELSEHR